MKIQMQGYLGTYSTSDLLTIDDDIPLVEELSDYTGEIITINYQIGDMPQETISGLATVDFDTDYARTDEDYVEALERIFRIGGFDFIKALKKHIGQYIHFELIIGNDA